MSIGLDTFRKYTSSRIRDKRTELIRNRRDGSAQED